MEPKREIGRAARARRIAAADRTGGYPVIRYLSMPLRERP